MTDGPPAAWLYPTSTVIKSHYFPSGETRSLCGKYGRWLSDHGWTMPSGQHPKDACLPCARKKDKMEEAKTRV